MADIRATLQRMFEEVINNGRLEVADEVFADDFVDHGPMGDIYGREAFKGLVNQWRSAVPDVHCALENVIVEGDVAGWVVRTTGTHTGDGLGFPATNKPFETVTANIARFRDGVVVEHWSEQGFLSMLAQIGMMPPLGS
ncbi:MAG: ester cyclase [Actinomycetota bacterium]|nr:ester cyclase [Actinomycetota bacterium]